MQAIKVRRETLYKLQHLKCCSGECVPQAAGTCSASWLLGQNAARTTDNTPEASEVVRRHGRRRYHFTRAAPFTRLAGSCHEQQEFEADPAHRISIDPNRELHPLVRKTPALLNGRVSHTDKDLPLAVDPQIVAG